MNACTNNRSYPEVLSCRILETTCQNEISSRLGEITSCEMWSQSLFLSLSLSLQFNWLWVGTEKHSRSVCSPQRSLNRPTWLLCSAGRLSGRLFPRALFLRGRVAREQSRGHSQHAENCARAAASERGILPRSGNAEFLRDSGRFGGNATRWRTHTHTHTA